MIEIREEKCEEVANKAKMVFADQELTNAEIYVIFGMMLDGLMDLRREKYES